MIYLFGYVLAVKFELLSVLVPHNFGGWRCHNLSGQNNAVAFRNANALERLQNLR